MRKHRWIVYILLAMILATLSACQLTKRENTRPAPKRKQSQEKKAKEKPQLPVQFSSMEATSLKMYNAEFKDWNEAKKLNEDLKLDWQSLKGELQKTKSPKDKQAEVEMHLGAIDRAVKKQSQFELSEHANELIGSLQELTKKFKTTTPPEIITAQTDLREISLHVGRGDWTILKDLSKNAQKDWKKVAPKAKKAGAKGVGENLEGYFKELDAAIKEKDVEKAQAVIDLMDADLANLRTAMEKQEKQGNKRSGS